MSTVQIKRSTNRSQSTRSCGIVLQKFDSLVSTIPRSRSLSLFSFYFNTQLLHLPRFIIPSAYFEEKGLVRQQLDSFDEFIQNTMQELVDDSGDIRVTPEIQHLVGYDEEISADDAPGLKKVFEIKFGQVYLSKPTVVEKDGTVTNIFPHEARLRNLTYSAPLYVDVTLNEYRVASDVNIGNPTESLGKPIQTEMAPREFLGYVPIMLRSLFCVLSDKIDAELSDLAECIYDQGGYFIINGSEKVIIAQERLSNNHVYAFKKKQPSKFSWVIETRSQVENSTRPTSTLYLQMYHKSAKGTIEGNQIRSTLPYIRTDIPVVIIFRALGFVADRDIIEHVVYDLTDGEMMDLFRPSIEEAFVIQKQESALDFIGRRGSAKDVTKEDRIRYAAGILQKEVLPHVGTEEHCESKKGFFLGYAVHKLLMCKLGRADEDDRDHFGKKRLDLAGPLLGGLFRTLFRKLTKDVRKHLQRCLDEGKHFNIGAAIKSNHISDGLKYSLATGNCTLSLSCTLICIVSYVPCFDFVSIAIIIAHIHFASAQLGFKGVTRAQPFGREFLRC